MGYLGINKLGYAFSVYDSNDVNMGTIYPNERFSVIVRGTGQSVIDFRNKSGQWVRGYCRDDSKALSDWANYLFYHGAWARKGFKTDKAVNMYNSGKVFVRTYPAGSFIIPCKEPLTEYQNGDVTSTQIGTTNTDWLRIAGVLDPNGNYDYPYEAGMFIDCKIRANSTNTPVYGNW